MGLRKGSASILCATIGLGLSQNFAVSAAGQKRCGDQTLKRDGGQIQILQEDIDLYKNRSKQKNDSFFNFVDKYFREISLAVLTPCILIMIYLLIENNKLKGELDVSKFKAFFRICNKLELPTGKSWEIFELVSKRDTKAAIKEVLSCFEKNICNNKYLPSDVIIPISIICGVFDSDSDLSESLAKIHKIKYRNKRHAYRLALLARILSKLGDDYKAVLDQTLDIEKKMIMEKSGELNNNNSNIKNDVNFININGIQAND